MKTKITFLLFILLSVTASFAQPISEAEKERQFLGWKWFYESLENQDKATLLPGWSFENNTDFTIDNTWEGLTVDADGYVTEVDISGKGLITEFTYDEDAKIHSKNRFCWIYCPKLKKINFSDNQFSGYMPFVWYTENPNPYPPVTPRYSLPELEVFNISNNNFISTFGGFYGTYLHLKEIRASNNNFNLFGLSSFHGYPNLKIIDISNNILGSFGINDEFFLDIPDTMDLKLDTLNISGNLLYYSNLWQFTEPGNYTLKVRKQYQETGQGNKYDTLWNTGSHRLFYDKDVVLEYLPQKLVSMSRILVDNKVRAQVGDSIIVALPQRTGHSDPNYPQIPDSLLFKWYKKGVVDTLVFTDINPFFIIDSVTENDFGTYFCEISYTGERLKKLELQTETFEIVNEENLPPVIKIENNVPQLQRIIKGGTSQYTKLAFEDDIPFPEFGLEWHRGKSEITKYPSHLEIISSSPMFIEVKDTSAFDWVGFDTIGVTHCDFEGACTYFELYYEVYDNLYAPLIDTVMVDENRVMTIKWSSDIYDTKVEKPDGYYLLLDTSSLTGGAQQVSIDSIAVTGINTNTVSFTLPDADLEYILRGMLYAVKNGNPSYNASLLFSPMPVKPDTNLKAYKSTEGVQLSWELKSTPMQFPITHNNNIYRSEDGIHYIKIGAVVNLTINDSYTDTTAENNKTYYYKLIKQVTSFDVWSMEYELPYLVSNVAVINTNDTVEESLLTPPIILIEADTNRKMEITWDTTIYEGLNTKPMGYLVSTGICTNAVNECNPQYHDMILGAETNSFLFPIPEENLDFLLKILLQAKQDSNSYASDTSIIEIPIPLKADSITNAAVTKNSVTLTWKLNENTLFGEFISLNTIYFSEDGINYKKLHTTSFSATTYTHQISTENKNLWYKLVKSTMDILEFNLLVELPYLESNIIKIENKPVSISDIIPPHEIKIYPNPFKDIVCIENTNSMIETISIISLTGEKYNTYKPDGKGMINLNLMSLPAGIYILEIGTKNNTFQYEKIIKM